MKYILLVFLLFFTGCSIKKDINSYTLEEKKTFYQKTKDEIAFYKNEGSTYYYNTHYKMALEAYEKVNFYEQKNIYSNRFIRLLKKESKVNAKIYYKKAKALVKKEKIKALYFFNKMSLNSNIKEASLELEELKKDEKVKIFIKELEDTLSKKVSSYDKSIKSFIEITKAYDKLFIYDYNNPLVLKTYGLLKSNYFVFLDEARTLYSKKKYKEARKILIGLKKLYTKNRVVNSYLVLVDKRGLKNKSKKKIESKSKKTVKVEAKKSQETISNETVSYDEESLENNEISSEEVNSLIKKGVDFYGNQDFEQAKNIFNEVLENDEKNITALTYLKKINSRLKTINSLQ